MKLQKRYSAILALALALCLSLPVFAAPAADATKVINWGSGGTADKITEEFFISQNTDIRITGTVEMSAPITVLGGTVTITGVDGGTLKRVSNNAGRDYSSGNMLNVEGGSVTLTNITLDGAQIAVGTSEHAGVNVTGGSLTIGSGTVLKNHYVYDAYVSGGTQYEEHACGSAIRQLGGTITMAEGSGIFDCRARNFGNVYVGRDAKFTMAGGEIHDCGMSEARLIRHGGGAFYVAGEFVMTGGAIYRNSAASSNENYQAVSYGGGIYCGGGTVDLRGGAIGSKVDGRAESDNVAVYGVNVYYTASSDYKVKAGADVVDADTVASSATVTASTDTEQMNFYEIRLDTQGGTIDGATTFRVMQEGVCGVLPTPVKSGSVFRGWYTSPTGGEAFTESTIVHGSATYYARWKERQEALEIQDSWVELSDETDETYVDGIYLYDGARKKPTVTVRNGGAPLTEVQDYQVEYADNIAAGIAKVIVTGVGSYTGVATKEFLISSGNNLELAAVALETSAYTYDGAAKEPAVTVTLDGKTLTKNTDYQVDYADNVDAGTATVTITATASGDYTGSKVVEFTIEKADPVVKAPTPADALIYSGEEQALVVAGETSGGTMKYSLSEDGDWSADVPKGTDAGTYTVWYQVEGDQNYSGTDKASLEATIYCLVRWEGVERDDMLVESGTVLERPDDPERTGYTFGGWYRDGGLSDPWDFATPVTDNLTLRAKWTAVEYSVTYDLAGGETETDNPARYTVEDEFTLENPTREGYTFLGWTGTGLDAASTRVTIEKGSAGDRSYTAVWTNDPLRGELAILAEPRAEYGGKLTAAVTDANSELLLYTWKRGGETVPSDAISNEYTLTAEDVGKTITCEVTSEDKNGILQTSGVVIGKKTVAVISLGPQRKTYDGAADIVLDCEGAAFAGVVDGDTVSVKGSGEFARADAGEALPVTVRSLTLDEESAKKYALDEGYRELAVTGEIEKANLSEVTVAPINDRAYTGGAIEPDVTASYQGMTLVRGTDYEAAYSDNKELGKATITLTAGEDGNYTGAISVQFNIVKKVLENGMVTLSPASFTYDGTEKKPAVTVKVGGETLAEGEDRDYTVLYADNVNVGTATVTVTGRGNYGGVASKTFAITAREGGLSGAMVTLSAYNDLYDGTAKEPAVTVTLGGKTLTKNTDYQVGYVNNVEAGTATVTVTGVGNYSGSVSRSFPITSNNLGAATVTLSQSSYPYDGTAKEPAVTVRLGGRTLTEGSDYTVRYGNNTGIGTATVTVAATSGGVYTGSKQTDFSIVSAAVVYHTVTYRNGGGSGATFSETVPNGTTISLPGAEAFGAPSGRQFRAWRIDGWDYAPYRDYTVYYDVIATAQWENESAAAPVVTTPAPVATSAVTQPVRPRATVKDCERNGSCPIAAFPDTQANAWYHDGMHWALERGVVSGVIRKGVLQLEPYGLTTRAQLVTMLWRLDGAPWSGSGQPFGDVEASAYYATAARWANERGISGGSGGGRFGPDEELTREEVVTILYNYARYRGMDTGGVASLSDYADGYAVSASSSAAVRWALGQGVIYGRQGSWLDPQDGTNRAEVVTMLYRVFGE